MSAIKMVFVHWEHALAVVLRTLWPMLESALNKCSYTERLGTWMEEVKYKFKLKVAFASEVVHD